MTAFIVPVFTLLGSLRSRGFPRFVHQVGFLNVVLGFCALVLIVSSPFPIWSLRWWEKYAKLPSDDEDFQNGRKMVRAAGLIAATAFLTFALLACLVLLLKSTH